MTLTIFFKYSWEYSRPFLRVVQRDRKERTKPKEPKKLLEGSADVKFELEQSIFSLAIALIRKKELLLKIIMQEAEKDSKRVD